MAGIKQIYRSPDAFRLPTYDPEIAYSVNSIVAYYDSDTTSWYHYISKQNTTPGSLDSDIALNEWALFSFDSDTLAKHANEAVLNNFDALSNNLSANFSTTLSQLQTNNDSDFGVFYNKVDSDIKFVKHYVDSEILVLQTQLSTDFDSDVLKLTTVVNNYSDELQYGRVYDSETIKGEINTNRIVDVRYAGNKDAMSSYFIDTIQESTPISWNASTQYNASLNFETGLTAQNIGKHVIIGGIDSETIFSSFTVPAYVSSISFTGNIYGGYFTSAYVTWTYEDSTTYTQDHYQAVLKSTSRLYMFNPYLNKRVTNIDIIAYNRSSDSPGINNIQMTSCTRLPLLRAERANLLHFDTTFEMLKYAPHSDTIAFVKSIDTLFVNEDSEWKASDPRYVAVDTTIENLKINWPQANYPENSRALTSLNGYEYTIQGGQWTLDVKSIEGYDSDLLLSLDSDVKDLKQEFLSHKQIVDARLEWDDERIEKLDSEVLWLTKGWNTFYVDYVNLKLEHRRVHLDVDSDVNTWNTRFNDLIASYNASRDSDYANLVADRDYWRASLITDINNTLVIQDDKIQNVKETLDSDNLEIRVAILANSTDISLLRNGEVADNDSDIRALERLTEKYDSDITYNRNVAMKYRGTINLADSDVYPLMVEVGDVYITTTSDRAVSLWGPLKNEDIKSGSSVMFTSEYGWTAINNNNAGQEQSLGVPAGTIMAFPTVESVPTSFRICDGSVYDPGLYSELFEKLGTNLLPDLRGYFLRAWSDDATIDPDGPRAPLSIQTDELGSHTHTYIDRYLNSTAEVSSIDDETVADRYGINQTRTTNPTGGDETRPKNIAVIYAIAMYSGAGGLLAMDSDLRAKQAEMDSDLVVLTHDSRATDSDLRIEIHTRQSNDSDTQVQIVDNDSDILALQTKVNTLVGQFNLAQFSTVFALGGAVTSLNVGVEYDITSEVINTATPENFCYPDIQFFYETQGANVNTAAAGRRLDGTNGTPQLSYRVIHDAAGNVAIGMNTSATVTHDIRIVSTFRTQ